MVNYNLATQREEQKERLEDDAEALMEGERDPRVVFDDDEQQAGALNHKEDLEDPRWIMKGVWR